MRRSNLLIIICVCLWFTCPGILSKAYGDGSISGTISYGGTQTGTVIVAVFDSPLLCAPSDAEPYKYSFMPSPGSYTVSGLQDGTYYLASVILTCGSDCELQATDPWGIYSGCANIIPVAISGGNAVTGINITLVDGTAQNPNPFYTKYDTWAKSVNDPHNGFWIDLGIDDTAHDAVTVTVTGPGVSGAMSLEYDNSRGEWSIPEGSEISFGQSYPAPPLTYTFTITDSSGTVTQEEVIEDFIEVFATGLSPSGGEAVMGTPVFSWTGVSGEYVYRAGVYGNGINWRTDNMSSTSAVYDGPALTVGNYYNWQVEVRDVHGNCSRVWENFKYVQGRTLTVQRNGAGTGRVVSALPGIDCGSGCVRTYGEGTVVTLSAVPDAGYAFGGWSGGGCSGKGYCVTQINADTTVIATFVSSTGSISGNVSYGGSQTGTIIVAAFDSPVSCESSDKEPYKYVVVPSLGNYTVTGLPDGTYYMASVILTCGSDCSSGPLDPWGIYNGCGSVTPVVINGGSTASGINITLVDGTAESPAPFYDPYDTSASSGHDSNGYWVSLGVKDAAYEITSVSVSGPGFSGTVALGYDTGRGEWRSSLAPGGNPYWNINPPVPPLTYTFTITSSAGITTMSRVVNNFVHDFASGLSPSGGALVTGNPEFSWTGLGGNYEYRVELNGNGVSWRNEWNTSTSVTYAGPDLSPGKTYNWTVRVRDIYGNTSNVGASFAYASQYTLTVNKVGTGSGKVTSSPSGIDCGSDCSNVYISGTKVMLTAIPDSGSAFAGWTGGGCSGTGKCPFPLNSDTEITATFVIPGDDPITVTVEPQSAPADSEAGFTFRTRAPMGGGAVLFELFYDFNGNGIIDADEWPIDSKLCVDNIPLQGDLLNCDHDFTPLNITVNLDFMGGIFPSGKYIIRVLNIIGESDIAQFTLTPVSADQTVTGTVYRQGTTTPVQNAVTYCSDPVTGSFISAAFTDSNGNYSLQIPGPVPRDIFVGASGKGYVSLANLPLTVPAGGVTGFNLYLQPSDAVITGTLTEYGSGNPVWGSEIWADTSDNRDTSTLTGMNGSYTLPVLEGIEWRMGVDKVPGYFFIRASSHGYEKNPVITPTAAGPNTVHFTAHKETAWIEGTVKDEYGNEPVEGVSVYANRMNTADPALQNLSNSHDTNVSGQVTLGVEPGDWRTGCNNNQIHAGDQREMVSFVEEQYITPLIYGEHRDVQFNLYYADGAVEGTVYSDGGTTPVSEGIYVSAWTDNALNGPEQSSVGSMYVSTETDANGHFRLPLLGGTWHIMAWISDETHTLDKVVNLATDGNDFIDKPGETISGVNLAPEVILTIIKYGTGNGVVTSLPEGIDCGNNCSVKFASGTEITLTATPDYASFFGGWSGSGCSGTRECIISITENQTVTAAFFIKGGTVQLTDSNWLDKDNYQPGEDVYVQVADADANTNPFVQETLTVQLTSTTETTPEVITLTETGINTGIFRGSIGLDDASGVAAADGDLDVAKGDFITVAYNDASDDFGNPRTITDTAIFGATVLSGRNITTDTTWTKTNSPYVLTGDIVVEGGTTLTIEPGTEIRFAPNHDENNQGSYHDKIEIIVYGTLNAEGTEKDRIVFTSNAVEKTAGDWGGIRFSGGWRNGDNYFGGGTIRYLTIEYAESPVFHNWTQASSITIDNSILTGNNGGIEAYISGPETLTISNNVLSGNNIGYDNFIFVNANSPLDVTISGNEIKGNNFNGEYIIYSDYGTIASNTIHDNTGWATYGIYGYGTISNNTVTGNSFSSGAIYSGRNAVISGNMITGNTANYHGAVYLTGWGHEGVVSGNTIKDNTNASGITIYGNNENDLYSPEITDNTITGNKYGIYTVSNAVPKVNGNNIYGNTLYDYFNNTIYDQDAKNNNWGELVTYDIEKGTNPKNISRIYDYFDNRNLGKVDYSEWQSNEILIPPSALNGVSGNASVYLSWSPVGGAVDYIVSYGTEPGVYSLSVRTEDNHMNYPLTGLDNGTVYYMAVKAVDENNIESGYSPEINVIPDTRLKGIPGDTEIYLTWLPALGAADYIVRYGTDSGMYEGSVYSKNVVSHFPLTGLNNGMPYYITVSAVSENGEEFAQSNEIEIVPDSNGKVYPPSPSIDSSLQDYDFGEVLIGSMSEKNAIITNYGTGKLKIDSITSDSGVFSVDSPFLPVDIGPGSFISIALSFMPVAKLDYSGTVTVISNDSESGPLFIDLKGSGRVLEADLSVSNIKTSAEGWSGREFDVQWTTANHGPADVSGLWTDRIYLSDDNIRENDIALDEIGFSDYISAGGSLTRLQTVSLPDGVEGNYWIIICTDVNDEIYEYNKENNNCTVSDKSLPIYLSSYPDLAVSIIGIPSEAWSGQKIQISWTITNSGMGATDAGYWFDKVYLSPTHDLSGAINLGQEINQSYLVSGESYTQIKEYALPFDISGSYYVIVQTDVEGHVYEWQSENNNILASASPITIHFIPQPRPDLSVTQFQAPSNAYAGQEISVSWTVKNIGSAVADKFTQLDWVMLSDDSNPSSFDKHIGPYFWNHNVSLMPDQEYTKSETVPLPLDIEGTHYLFAWTDVRGELNDPDWGNNFSALKAIEITKSPPSDLEVISVESALSVRAGMKLDISWTVKNNGPGTTISNSWTDFVYLSENETLDVGTDVRLYSSGIYGQLGIDNSYTKSISAFVPASISGTYHLIVCADSSMTEGEFYEDNNCFSSSPVQIILNECDLEVTDIAAPSMAIAGESIRIRWQVTNSGADSTVVSSWRDSVYLSADHSLSTTNDNILIKQFVHNGDLSGQNSYAKDEIISLPQGVSGTYYLIVSIDETDNVYEHNRENNNAAYAMIEISRILPDLAVISLVAPSGVDSGSDIEICWQGINQGTDPVPLFQSQWSDRLSLCHNNNQGPVCTALVSVSHSQVLEPDDRYNKCVSARIPYDISGDFYLEACPKSRFRKLAMPLQ